jgi:hypothetical protein
MLRSVISGDVSRLGAGGDVEVPQADSAKRRCACGLEGAAAIASRVLCRRGDPVVSRSAALSAFPGRAIQISGVPLRPPPAKGLRQAPAQPGHPHCLPPQDRTALACEAGPGRRQTPRRGQHVRYPPRESAPGSLADTTFDTPCPSSSRHFSFTLQPLLIPGERPSPAGYPTCTPPGDDNQEQ